MHIPAGFEGIGAVFSTRRGGPKTGLAVLASAVVLLVGVAATGDAVSQSGQSPAAAHTQRGVQLIGEGDLEGALAAFDDAITADEQFGMAYYQRGRTLAQLGRMEEASESLMRSTRLQPGFAHGHLLASLAAQELGDYETAWDQAVRAILAGRETSEFGGLHTVSPAPAEVVERLNAWKIFVVGVDTRELIARDQGPDNARGGVTDIRSTIGQVQNDLLAVQRHLANAISDTPGFGLVPSAELAQYLLVIVADEVEADPRHTMEGELRVYDATTQDVAFVRPVSFRNLSAESAVTVEIGQFIDLLENWKRERQ